MKFNEMEFDIAREIINIGLGKAADSMSFFTKKKVLIRNVDLQIKNIDSLSTISKKKKDEELYVLSTEIKGELEGICYLLLSETEVYQIMKASLPPSVMNDSAKYKIMSREILLEMDNIIVASVVTQFSNFFKYKMYGDVPGLTKTNDFNQLVQSANLKSDYFLYFRSELNTSEMNINPEFIWLLNDKYCEGVKSVANDSEALSKMRMSK